MKIILTGYMGSGKTTIGKQIAKKIGIPFYDLDRIIEDYEKKSIATIFSEKGEIYFRKLESKVLLDFISSTKEFVLALGGGTPCYGNNSVVLQREDVQSYYLKASVETLMNRLTKEKKPRPLIANLSNEELNEFIRKHLFDRNYYYLQSKKVVSIDNKTVDEIITDLL